MSTYHTVDGQSYAVTAGAEDATITDSSGLSRTVNAGTQYSFLGDGGDVTVDGPHHFTQLKGMFGNGGGGGGGQKITVDDYLDHTYTSLNPVQNRVLAYAIDSKQDKLTIDPAPVVGSANPVASGGVQSCLADKASLAGTNVFTGTNSFNGTVGGSGVKDYADGYAPSDTKLSSLPTDSEMSTEGATWANGLDVIRSSPIPMPLQLRPTLYGIDSDGVTRISVRVARGTGGDLAVPRHHYLLPGLNPGGDKTKDVTSLPYFRTVNPVSYYDTDWEADKGYTKVVEFVSKDPNGYSLATGDLCTYGVSSNSEDPTDTTTVKVDTVVSIAKEWPEWFAVCNGASMSFFGKFARFTYYQSSLRDRFAYTAVIEATRRNTTKDRIDDAAKKGEDNTFNGENTFSSGVITLSNSYGDQRSSGKLSNYNGDLYWGATKLNVDLGYYAKLGDSNVFTGYNTFSVDTAFTNGARFDNQGYQVGCNVLYNYYGNLYWGNTKLGGGGDVRAAGDNVFTGYNTFSGGINVIGGGYANIDVDLIVDRGTASFLNGLGVGGGSMKEGKLTNHNGDLYWGWSKIKTTGDTGTYAALEGRNTFNGVNEFTSRAVFSGQAEFTSAASFSCTPALNAGAVLPNPGTDTRQPCTIANYGGDLYWGTCKLNGQTVTVDTYPVMGSTNPVSSGGMYPTPVLVVQGGIAQFPSRLRDNGIYVLWDNDLADRSAEIVIDPDTRPNEYSTAEIHIFNHTDTPVSIKWPASWHWRTMEGDYELDTEASQHVPVLKGNSCMCITVRCSVDRGTHFMPPPMTIVPFVMAEKAYEYTLSENTQQEG